ncbi:MAG: methyltransferase domain-containing protein [bacterium]|nr:methyltransferase domain-containing protein [bacterium]
MGYRNFLARLEPLMAAGRPARIIDLATGHGGFALALARLARERGLDLEITATDIKSEYLDMGRRRAKAEGLAVDFRVQDAVDLSNLSLGQFDFVTCTQSLHHFPPGLVAVMFAEAARVATRAVLFIDGCRTFVRAVPLYAFCRLGQRDRIIAHDGWVSFRRFFVPEELDVLARLGPWGRRARAYRIPPTHCVLELRK